MSDVNPNARLEAFCDAVFAIAMTLLVIDVKLPAGEQFTSNAQLWQALAGLLPAMFAFALSFIVILITWVNHHGSLKLVHGSSGAFIYANGFLLLTVAFIPLPTSLLADFLLTDHATPAIVLYDVVLALQAVAWLIMGATALHDGLARDEASASIFRRNMRYARLSAALSTLLAVAAFWLPLGSLMVTTASWIFWLVQGIRMKHE